MIAKLIAEIARLKRRQYGRSAEPMDGDLLAQLQLALDDLRVEATLVQVSGKSDLGGAIKYALLRRAALTLFSRDVLERIADHPINRIDELLPWNVQLAPFEERLAA